MGVIYKFDIITYTFGAGLGRANASSNVNRYCQEFGDHEVDQVSSDDVLRFLDRFTEGNNPCPKRILYSHLCVFFNFVRNNLDHDLINPCDSPMIRKLYREVGSKWEINEKERIETSIANDERCPPERGYTPSIT